MKINIRNERRNNQQEIGFFRECQRFRPKERAEEQTEEDAMVYLRLRRAGVKKEKALKFCQGQHCKVDSTQDKHGPPGYKIFKTKIDKFKLLQGWQLVGKLRYEHAIKFQAAKEDVSLAQQVNKDEQKRLEQLKLYYTNLDEKYSFANLSREELVEKLRSLSTQESRISRTPRYQMKVKNQMYYELADYLHDKKDPENTLINEMEAFEDIGIKDQFLIEPKVIEKAPPFYKQQHYLERRSKLMKELALTYRGRMTLDEPKEDLKMAIRNIYKQEFNQSNYISRVSEHTSSPAITSLQDYDDSSDSRRKCSILSHRFSRFKIPDEIVKANTFRRKLDNLVRQGMDKIYSQSPI